MSHRRCSIVGCREKSNLFSLPKDESTRKRWEDFLMSVCTKPRFLFSGPTCAQSSLFVCARHFTEDSFDNKVQYSAGYSAKLRLKSGAFPSLNNACTEEPDEEDLSSEELPLTCIKTEDNPSQILSWPQRTACVATQTSYLMVSVGTQRNYIPSTKTAGTQSSVMMLSIGTQCSMKSSTKPAATQSFCKRSTNMRRKGTQDRVHCKSDRKCSTEQDGEIQQPSSSVEAPAPLLDVGSAKRLRVENLKEEEKEYEIISDTPQPGDSLTEPVETRKSNSTRSFDEQECIVFESCLRDLFQTCPVCEQHCEMLQETLGTSVSFSQQCHTCLFSRKWQSETVARSEVTDNS
ncbi:uncharacterized protein LOC132955727 [Labrus mixtus]|uniref:uncharacterized protein LOC132955727 n=1 Tax=Labrus mixtus TaxID=508554 RepID=UPI0029C0286A|nr:uncharacterized protein LOC132955727 [Labrus mixtus]